MDLVANKNLFYYLHQNRPLQSIGIVCLLFFFVELDLFLIENKKTYHKIDVNIQQSTCIQARQTWMNWVLPTHWHGIDDVRTPRVNSMNENYIVWIYPVQILKVPCHVWGQKYQVLSNIKIYDLNLRRHVNKVILMLYS
jgi:hypothetical protein